MSYMIENEPFGLEEHEAFEAGAEDMELAAMRREAEREWLMEAMMAADEEREEREIAQHDWACQQADPLRAVCLPGSPILCEEVPVDNIPF